MKKYMIAEIIQRAERPGYEFREREKQHSAIITALCFLSIGLAVALAFLCRSCSPDPVPAYSMCEQCGELIGATDHGRCQDDKVYVRAIIDPAVAQANMKSISGYVTNKNGLVCFAVRGPACE